ncbi:MAG: hypothetical protein ACTHMG_00690 [Sphingomonas sp.]
MDSSQTESGQTMQRIKVGMTGLAVILLLIALASAIFPWTSKDKPIDVAGGSDANVVANISITNDNAPAPSGKSEPLAELGVAPSTVGANTAAPENQTVAVPPVDAPPLDQPTTER